MLKISIEDSNLIRGYVRWFERRFNNDFMSVLSDNIHYFKETKELNNVNEQLDKLQKALEIQTPNAWIELPDDVIPCLKRVLVARRRDEASNYDLAKQTTIHPELIDNLESKIKPLDELIQQPAFANIEPMKMPKYTDFLSIQQIEKHWTNTTNQDVREYDEKFHILQAPGQLLDDLKKYRRKCEMRGTSVVIAYIDIDDFKSFNSKYGHTKVDRRILPTLMRLLEAHVFTHGYAYRFGGDEYVMLLPNIDFNLAAAFLDELRRKVAELQYQEIDEKTNISIGFCCLEADSYLTNREAEERANKAMTFAKTSGSKNCVASFKKSQFDDDSLYVVSR